MGELRGVKRDLWEGDHRVPFIAKWLREVAAGATCDELISLSGFMATCAEITGATIANGEAEDSVSILKLLRGGPTFRHGSLPFTIVVMGGSLCGGETGC
jgi:arylsulfatase A